MSYGKIDPKLLATVEVLQSRITELENQVKRLGVINATRQPEAAQGDARRRQGREQDRHPAQGWQGIRQVGQGRQIAGPQDFPQAVICKITPL